MPQLDFDGANSKISADKIQGQSGTTVTIPAGHNLAGDGSGLTSLSAANLTGAMASGVTGILFPNEKMCAYRTTNQTLPHNSWTKVQLDGEIFDPGSDFDNSTNYRWTCPTTGYYLAYGVYHLNTPNANANDQAGVAIYLNGSTGANLESNCSDNGSHGVNCLQLFSLNATDYLELYAYMYDGTSGAADTIRAGSQYSYMFIQRVA